MRNNRRPDGRKFGGCIIGVAVAGLIGLGAVPHLDRDTYTATVTDKERIVESNEDSVSSKYLVFTELESGEVRVFENTDSLLEGKFNSSDFQGRLREGQTYEIKTYGWRIPFLSAYENIIDVREASQR